MSPQRQLWLLAAGYGAVIAATTAFAPLVAAWILLPSLAILAVFGWKAWRSGTSPFGGSAIIIYFAGCIAYLLGSIPLSDTAPYANVIPPAQWMLYLWAAMAAAIALVAGTLAQQVIRTTRFARRRLSSTRTPSFPGWALYVPAAFGLTITWVNFITGRIPLLEESINAARREESVAILSDLGFASYSTLEFAIVAAVALPLRRVPRWVRIMIVVLAVGTLVLSGSRSFLVFPTIALAFILVETKKPNLGLIAGIAAVLAVAVGIAGQLRAFASGSGTNVLENAEKWGYGSPLTSSIFSNLQVGPHVFAAVQEVIPRTIPFQNGVFFLRDFPKLSAGARSDFWITETVLGRDSVANGGLPPTILGGLYVDWGYVGAVVGVAVVFLALTMLRPRAVPFFRSQPRTIAYGILCAYILTSYYSYLSLKASTLVMFLWCAFVYGSRWVDVWRRNFVRGRHERS